MSDTVQTAGLSFDEQPVDDQGANEIRLVVVQGDDLIDMHCLGEVQADGTVIVRMSQLEVLELLASLPRALHVAARNGAQT